MEIVHKLLVFGTMIETFISLFAKLTQNKSLFITLLIPRREIPGQTKRRTIGQTQSLRFSGLHE
jgi:hypothetical protein